MVFEEFSEGRPPCFFCVAYMYNLKKKLSFLWMVVVGGWWCWVTNQSERFDGGVTFLEPQTTRDKSIDR